MENLRKSFFFIPEHFFLALCVCHFQRSANYFLVISVKYDVIVSMHAIGSDSIS